MAGNKDVSGIETLDISDGLEPGDYTLTLKCENSYERFDEKTRSFELRDRCSDRLPLSQLNSKFSPASSFHAGGDGNSFADIWQPWPGQHGRPKNIWLHRNTYAQLKFNSGTFPGPNKYVHMTTEGTKGGEEGVHIPFSRGILWAISTCPGDFNEVAISADPMTEGKCFGIATSMKMSTPGMRLTSHCELVENQVYYLNIIAVDGNAPANPADIVWSCGPGDADDVCGALMGPKGTWKPQ